MNTEPQSGMLGFGDAFLDNMSSMIFCDPSMEPSRLLLDDLNPIPIPVRISEPDLQQHVHRRPSDSSAAITTSASPMAVSASSCVSSQSAPAPAPMAASCTKKTSVKNAASKFDFPFRLHEMLNVTTTTRDEALSHIAWMPLGTSFKILNTAKFAQQTLPKFFPNSQYKSFIRQLNIYGFNRIKDRKSPAYGEYSHKLFVRGKPDLCMLMSRQKIKGTGVPRSAAKRKILLSWNVSEQEKHLNSGTRLPSHFPSGVQIARLHSGNAASSVKSLAHSLAPSAFCAAPFSPLQKPGHRNTSNTPATDAANAMRETFSSSHSEEPAFFSPQNIFGINVRTDHV